VLATIGRLSARYRWAVVVGWVVLAVVGATIGSRVFDRLSDSGGAAASFESIRAYDLLSEASPYGPRLLAVVDGPVADPGWQGQVQAAAAEIAALPHVGRVLTAYDTPLPELTATDGSAQVVAVDLANGLGPAEHDETIDAVRGALGPLGDATGTAVLLGGTTEVYEDIAEQSERDLQRAELLAIPLTLGVMVIVFTGFLAAVIPLGVALVSIATALLGLLGFSYLTDLDPAVVQVTTVLGLGLAIDYGLLMVSRFREERAQGADIPEAIELMNTRAGRTITFSAVIVTVSLSGLFLFESTIYRAIGAAAVSVVVLALAAALTLTPALLTVFGRRIRMPASVGRDDGFFSRLARWVQHRAAAVVVVVGLGLLVLGAPFLGARYQLSGAGLLPTSAESRQVADRLAEDFPGGDVQTVTIVARTSAASLTAYARMLADRPEVAEVGQVTPIGGDLSSVDVRAVSARDASRALVRDLRADAPGFQTLVTGADAVLIDLGDEVRARAPWALLSVAVGTFVLLFLMTGSVLIPVKALVMNTLSLGATFGVLVLVFQDGHGDEMLGFTATGAIETWLPVITFAFAFGLSMDYEVFLISRIKEAHDSGLPNNEAVAVGLQRSGRIITSAALLILVVFLGFVTGRLISIKEIGLALSVAVVVDATLVRCLLVPATMDLLGEWNWWAPAPLRRLHRRLGFSERVTHLVP